MVKIIIGIILAIGSLGNIFAVADNGPKVAYVPFAILGGYLIYKGKKGLDLKKENSNKTSSVNVTANNITETQEVATIPYGVSKKIKHKQINQIEPIDKSISIPLGAYVGVDSKNKNFIVQSGKSTYKYHFSDLTDLEITNDCEQKITGNMLSTVAGGALFGPLGALAGSSKSRKIKTTKAKMYTFNLLINDLNCGNIKFDVPATIGEDKLTELTNTLRFILNNK